MLENWIFGKEKLTAHLRLPGLAFTPESACDRHPSLRSRFSPTEMVQPRIFLTLKARTAFEDVFLESSKKLSMGSGAQLPSMLS